MNLLINGARAKKEKDFWQVFKRDVYQTNPGLSIDNVYALYLVAKRSLVASGKYRVNDNTYEVRGGEPSERERASGKNKNVSKKRRRLR